MKEFDYDDLQAKALSHWGWGEETIRLPSDAVPTERLNGPCRTYHLGKPMKLQELETMPKDLQLAYLRKLRRMGGTQAAVGQMLGISPTQLLSRWHVRFDMPDPTAWAEFLGQC